MISSWYCINHRSCCWWRLFSFRHPFNKYISRIKRLFIDPKHVKKLGDWGLQLPCQDLRYEMRVRSSRKNSWISIYWSAGFKYRLSHESPTSSKYNNLASSQIKIPAAKRYLWKRMAGIESLADGYDWRRANEASKWCYCLTDCGQRCGSLIQDKG